MKLYVLSNPRSDDNEAVTDWLPVDGSTVGDAPRCHVCGRAIGALPLLPPVRVELKAWGRLWGDIAFGTGNGPLISDRFRRLVSDGGIVGFTEFHKADVSRATERAKDIGPPPRYYLARIARSRAAVDESASGVVRDGPRLGPECRSAGILRKLDRVVLEEATWSGEDIFIARGLPGTWMVTMRFADLVKDNELRNVHLTPAEEYKVDFGRPQMLRKG